MTNLHIETPLIPAAGCQNVMLKLENTQPSGSFKLRGIGHHCKLLYERGVRHFVSSSGGNAGLAVAYCGRQLAVKVSVFVPVTTSDSVVAELCSYGAHVVVTGDVWNDAHKAAQDFVAEDNKGALVHPFNHPEIWTGHASIIHELKAQLKKVPLRIVLSVGGGGLLVGVLEGLHAVGWSHVPVTAVETEGANCYNKALAANHPVTLPAITSVAKSLGALTVLPQALEWSKRHTIESRVVSDKHAVSACHRFLDDHKMLVEPACGAALTALYCDQNPNEELVVVIVCGGKGVNLDSLLKWKQLFNL